jgi:hypothetical protein
MNRNWSEAFRGQGTSLCRWAGATFAAVALSVGVAPAFAAAPLPLTLDVSVPTTGTPGTFVTYVATLTNVTGNTLNNVTLKLTAPSATGTFSALTPKCELSTTVVPCSFTTDPTVTPTSFGVAGYQLTGGAKLKITVGYLLPAAPTSPYFSINAAGSASNNSKNEDPSAYATLSVPKNITYTAPPPANPLISVSYAYSGPSPQIWSTPDCVGPTPALDCGASYYGQYQVTVKNDDTNPTNQAVNVLVSSSVADVVQVSDCSASSCAPTVVNSTPKAARVSIGAGLVGTTTFTVVFKSPQATTPALDVTTTTSIGSVAFGPSWPLIPSTPLGDAPVGTYTSVLPANLGGSGKSKDDLGPSPIYPDKPSRPFNSRADVPKGHPAPITISLTVTAEGISCSSSSPQCLDTIAKVEDSSGAVTFGTLNQALNGTDFLVIIMYRDYTTLNKKPSSVYNSSVWYTDDAGNRSLVKDCSKVDLTVVDRCVAERLDATTSAQGVLNGGYVKFTIWARHNGKIGY